MAKIVRSLAVVLLLAGCATTGSEVAQAPVPPEPGPYTIQAGDTLQVRFYYHPENDHEAVVRPDGKLLLPLVGETQAQGLTPAELATQVEKAYGTSLRDPKVAVTVKAMNENRIWVGGEVNKPGFVTLRQGLTALQAMLEAGGPKDTAKVEEVVLLQRPDSASRYKATKLNLAKALEGADTSGDRLLSASDVVFVPKSGIAKLDQFVDQYIIKVIPIRPTLPIF
jgi:protein involved in polysaccharide export with SLBB domain